jgi:integrase/recombinase XerD
MKTNGASERHQNNTLKVLIAFAFSLGKDITFYDVDKKDQILSFLDTKVKTQEQDPDKKWITTWNHNLVHLKRFFRWLHNHHKDEQEGNDIAESEWKNPLLHKYQKKKD